MQHKAFITNHETKTLKKRLEQLIAHGQEFKPHLPFIRTLIKDLSEEDRNATK